MTLKCIDRAARILISFNLIPWDLEGWFERQQSESLLRPPYGIMTPAANKSFKSIEKHIFLTFFFILQTWFSKDDIFPSLVE